MAKRPYIQRYRVTLTDGTVEEVCCGPSIPLKVKFIQSIGERKWGTCCHHQPPNLNEEIFVIIETKALQEGLKHLETMDTIYDKLKNKWVK